ncbi:MAG: helix-turn-helix domain-containing protein [Lachnospiraceae bacterium]|nr:helix-turn-helix domain-containing protein [Lachnospiraceae bacterium]
MRNYEKATFTVEETAKYLGIGRNLCYRMVREGNIPSVKLANRIIVPKVKLDEMLSK